MKKWFIGLACVGMLATAATGALTSPATLPVEYAGESGWTTANLDALTGWDAYQLGTVYAAPNASCKFDTAGDYIIIYFDSAPGEIIYSARRSDATALEGPYEAKLQESVDNATWSDVRTFDGSEFTGTLVTFTNALSSNSRYVKFVYVTKPTGQNFGIGYVKITTGGAAVFSVGFDKTPGFTVETGSSATITATAANGTPQYNYAWSTTMGVGDYSASGAAFTILATAPVGSFSAQVVATDNASAKVTNSINFSVVAQVEKYAITIATPVNGTVTTTPETQAAAGDTVTVNATPASGYAVGSITVTAADTSNVTMTGKTFTMLAQAVTVTVTFQEASTSGALIISQYYEGAGSDKWIEIYNPGASAVDLTAGGYRLGIWANTNRESWKTDVAPGGSVALTGSLAAGATYLVGHTSVTNPLYAVADIKSGTVCNFNGDDSVVLYTGATFAYANVVDAFGLTANTAADKSFVRKDTITAGVNTDFNAADWDQFTYAAVDAAAESTNERLGYHSTGAAVLGVSFDKTTGFTVETGSSATITATAANGTGPYTYAWSSTLAQSTSSNNVFTILATAPAGNYSAQVVASDSASAKVTNSLNFSVVAPVQKYAIAITAPVNGTVTTDPATEAAAGATVTVNATPAGGYAVETIVVSGGIGTLAGTTFTMPAQAVTVTFMEYTAPGALITFESGTLPAAYAASTATLEDGKVWSTDRVVKGNLEGDKKIGTLSARLYPVTDTNAVLQQTEAYAEPITKLSFSVARYGTDIMAGVVLTAEVSPDGSAWEVVKTLTEAAEITDTMTEHVVETIPANAVYVRFVATAGAKTGKRINLDNIGVDFGAATMSVSVNKANGFTVNEGSADSITATAANGTPEYTYSWGTTLPSGFSSAGAVFSILASAPVGNWSATVTATDATMATAQKTVTFSVVGLNPGDPAVVISGSLSGTVGVQMNLSITVTNETANDWFIDLKDPDALDNYSYDFNAPPAFTLTPTKVGTYVLTATAVTGSGSYSKTVNLTVNGAVVNPPIAAITMVVDGGGDFQFDVPVGYTLNRVEGADTLVGQDWNWATLVDPDDYTQVGSTITIKSSVGEKRMIRIWLN